MKSLLIATSIALFTTAILCSGNPFTGQKFYVNPSYQKELQTSISTASGKILENLNLMMNVPSAYWIDVKAKVQGTGTDSVEGILADSASKGGELVVLIVYDLPNRDCNAHASNGEVCCKYNADKTCDYTAGGDCSDGINEYKTTYVDPFAAAVAKYQDQVPIVLLIEPDSLGNLATNQGEPKCGNTGTNNAYKEGIKYAVDKLSSSCPKCTLYLDAAHGGWLGWSDNMQKFFKIVADMNIASKLKGFSTNVANYQPLGKACPWQEDDGWRNGYCLNGKNQGEECCTDPCKLEGQYDSGNNELNYATALVKAAKKILSADYTVIIDTGRNGNPATRADCSNWCNIRDAGVGLFPTTETGSDIVDAFYWLKTPGESDGCTQQLPDGSQCKRYDTMCGSVDSLGSQGGEPKAPEAGKWFDFQIKQLADNAGWTTDLHTCQNDQCVKSSSGEYPNLSSCQTGCGGSNPPSTKYDCNNNQCVESQSGSYTSLTSCQSACTAPASRFDCFGGQCVANTQGQFAQKSECDTACGVVTPKYTCQGDGNGCATSSSGEYSSMDECNNACWTYGFACGSSGDGKCGNQCENGHCCWTWSSGSSPSDPSADCRCSSKTCPTALKSFIKIISRNRN